jgi:NADPH:quinone reductase-like Zn-dependent oxidoreductase
VDVAGTVTAIGRQVTDLRPGDEVFGGTAGALAGGGFAEYASVPRDTVVAKPPGLTFAQAAAVPVAAVTALRALRDAARVRPGQMVLVNGASGGVGTFAVQVAKALGAEVTGVCSTSNGDLVRSIGANAVIDYTRDDFTRQPVRYDAVIDNVANHPLAACLHAVRPGGTLVPNANTPGRWLGGLGRIIKAQLIAPFVRQHIRTCHGKPNRRDLLAVTELIQAGKLVPVIDRTYPLSELPAAIEYLEQGHARGKIIVTM